MSMWMQLLSVMAVLLYLVVAGGVLAEWLGWIQSLHRRYYWWLSYPAILTHAYLLYRWIDQPDGQNLSFTNMFSLVAWVIAVLIIVSAWRKPITSLALLIFPVAACSVLLVNSHPGMHIVDTAANPQELWHILLSVLTVSVLMMAGLQAVLLALQEQQLRGRRAAFVLQKLPPLETMESLLFQLIWLGFILLTLLMITSLVFFRHGLTGMLLPKSLLVVVAWLIFGGLLIGRHYFGWRGRKAIYGTLSGVLLLVIVYFGSQLLARSWLA